MIAVVEREATPLAVWTLRRNVTVRVLPALEPLWHGGDVAAALDMVAVMGDDYVRLPGHDLVPFLTTDQVRALTAGDLELTAQVDWIASCITASHSPRNAIVSRINRAVTPEPLVDDGAETWSVAAAALILSRDPAIAVGRETLVAFLRELGWVTRENGIVVPAEHTIDAGTLRRNRVWNPRTKVAYNQVRVTREGLQALHDRLGGYAALALDVHPAPTLLEIP